jgi:hypothetical protein
MGRTLPKQFQGTHRPSASERFAGAALLGVEPTSRHGLTGPAHAGTLPSQATGSVLSRSSPARAGQGGS